MVSGVSGSPKWYRWWDFGNGTMSDLGSHWIDLPFWALKLKAPAMIEASGPPAHPELAPASMQVRYEYLASGEQPAVTLTWYQGTHKPEIWTTHGIPQWPSGVLFVGERGMILADYEKHLVLLDPAATRFERPAPSIPQSRGHHEEWIHACKTGAPTTCNFEYAGWLTEANHLGNVAYRAEDIEAIVSLVEEIRSSAPQGGITLTVSTFVPKPFTPFQWHPMTPLDTVKARLRTIKKGLATVKGVKVFHDVPKYVYMQGFFSLGDRRVSAVLEEMLRTEDWRRASSVAGLDPAFFIFREKEYGDALPWDFIDNGISKEHLWSSYQEAMAASA